MADGFVLIRTISDFENWWNNESPATRKIFAALTDESLGQKITDQHRTLGRIAWHIVQTLVEMPGRFGLPVDGPAENDPVPATAAEIQQAYDKASKSLLHVIKENWTDEMLLDEVDMYGSLWTKSFSLFVLIGHEAHHRAQMTVLMRQAGLKVPGIVGPSLEEWAAYGAPPPAI